MQVRKSSTESIGFPNRRRGATRPDDMLGDVANDPTMLVAGREFRAPGRIVGRSSKGAMS